MSELTAQKKRKTTVIGLTIGLLIGALYLGVLEFGTAPEQTKNYLTIALLSTGPILLTVALVTTKKRLGKAPAHLYWMLGFWALFLSFYIDRMPKTVSAGELNSWLATYDPFLGPEEEDLSFIYRDIEEFVGALSLEESSGHEPAIEAARAGAADYIRGATLSDLRKEWLGLSLRSGLLSVDQIDEEQLSSIAEELMARLAVDRDRHPGVVMPMYGFKDRLYQVLLLADSQLLPVEDRELLAEKIVAGITWEVRRQGPDEWMEQRENLVNDLPLSIKDVRYAVDMLVALDAKAALEEVEDMVLEALKNNYRPTDDSGVAGFVLFAEHAGGEDMNARYLGSADPAEGHALSLMERYGFPDFVDVQAFHKHFINASMGNPKPSGPFGEIHDGDEYLSAALRFRLEQLYPEL